MPFQKEVTPKTKKSPQGKTLKALFDNYENIFDYVLLPINISNILV
jgi:hypothetical protein